VGVTIILHKTEGYRRGFLLFHHNFTDIYYTSSSLEMMKLRQHFKVFSHFVNCPQNVFLWAVKVLPPTSFQNQPETNPSHFIVMLTHETILVTLTPAQ
jgi:hypothetical protein